MHIQLRPDLQSFVDEQVRRGRYASAEDAVNAAVAQLQTEQELTPDEVQNLRCDLDVGIAEADRGEFVEFGAEDIISERHTSSDAGRKA